MAHKKKASVSAEVKTDSIAEKMPAKSQGTKSAGAKEEVKEKLLSEKAENKSEECACKEVKKVEEKATVETKAVAEKVSVNTEAAVVEEKSCCKEAKMKDTFIIQFHGRELSREKVEERFKEVWSQDYGKNVADVKDVTFYIKPEEDAVYFVVNGVDQGSFLV
ncbi:MAG: DUF6465 family protein [Lachnospiraceae bacterium]|nr:DUF6465 family protein [Lachnospiraceae bacterium]